jgi:glycosyltransferase involved in cell wall biosynthesis
MLKFGIYTSFYNCEQFIENVFRQIELLNYDNFEWHITDDFSTDNTKLVLMDRLRNSPIAYKIKYHNQSVKKEMYWSPNLFFDTTFDWIVLMDADDYVDSNFLKIYDNILSNTTDVTLVSSDFHKIHYDNNLLHSISYVLNDESISNKINRYHPECNYLTNVSYSCFGHLRAFKNLPHIKFEITDRFAGAEDSYHVFWANSYGKYLHIPRPLYQWNMHTKSESHSIDILPNFNGNFDIALNKLKESDFGVDTYYNDVYVETCALGSYEFGKLSNKKISLWSRYLNTEQKQKLTNLYIDCKLSFNDNDTDIHIVCLNCFTDNLVETIINDNRDKSILCYYQNQKMHFNNDEKDNELVNQNNKYALILNNLGIQFYWWSYIRHLIFKIN